MGLNGTQDYRQCVDQLVADRDAFDQYIPSWFGSFDRRFHYMRDGIRVIDGNSRLIQEKIATNSLGPFSGHLISNAIEDCQRYREHYRSYARGSISLLMVSGLTLLLVMIWIAFRKRSTRATKVATVQERAVHDIKVG